MAINFGLLGALGQGLSEGVDSYRTQKDINQKKALQDQQLQIQKQQAQSGLLDKNQEIGEDGNVALNTLGEAQKKLQDITAQAGIAGGDPNSPASLQATQIARGAAAAAKPGLEKSIPDGMSATQLNDQAKGFLGDAVKGGFGMQGRLITAARIDASNNIKQQSIDERKNKNANQAGSEFEHDPIIKSSKGSINSLTRALGILDNTDKPLTAKDMNLMFTDYINSVAIGGAATDNKIRNELPSTYAGELNDFRAKFGDFQDLRKSETGQKLIQMFRSNVSTVKNDLSNAISDQAVNISDNYSANTNPQTVATVKNKLQKYAPTEYSKRYGSPNTAAQAPGGGGASLPSQQPGLLNSQSDSSAGTSSPPLKLAPGSVVNVKGTRMKVAADGNTLEPL